MSWCGGSGLRGGGSEMAVGGGSADDDDDDPRPRRTLLGSGDDPSLSPVLGRFCAGSVPRLKARYRSSFATCLADNSMFSARLASRTAIRFSCTAESVIGDESSKPLEGENGRAVEESSRRACSSTLSKSTVLFFSHSSA
jgi:hypothetical protein